MLPDPWLAPNRTVLADRLGISRSYLWERMALANNEPDDAAGLDLAVWYAAALEAGAPVDAPLEVFPEPPKPAPEPSGDSVVRLLGLGHHRASAFAGFFGSDRFAPSVVALAGEAATEVWSWHFQAILCALSLTERASLPAPVLRELSEWFGPEKLGIAAT